MDVNKILRRQKMSKIIDSFTEKNSFLSNFTPCRVSYAGVQFLSVEAAFQAAKCKEWEDTLKFRFLSAAESKKLGRTVKMRADWDDARNYRLVVMEQLLREKFSDKNPELKQKLIDTYDAELVEGNTWNDTFWGVCGGVGKNHLGILLMKIRKDLIRKG